MPAQISPHKIREYVSCPHQQQQIKKQKCSRPLLSDLDKHPHGKGDISERKNRSRGCQVCGSQVGTAHSDYTKQKRCNGCCKAGGINEDCGRCKRLLAGLNCEKQKEDRNENIGAAPKWANAIGFRELEQFMNS